MSCKSCDKNKVCMDCYELIDGVALQRKLAIPQKIILETTDGQKCFGELLIVSPVGLAIKIDNLVSSPWFLINIQGNFKLKVQRIANRGKDNYHGFDIMEVHRDTGISSRLNNEEYKVLAMTSDQLIDELTEDLPESVKNIVQERLKTELEKGKIFDALKVGQAIKYQNNNFKPLGRGTEKINLPQKDLRDIVQKCSKTGLPQRELFVQEDQIYDVHGIPFDYQSGGLLLLDVTSVINKERQIKEKELEIYREAIEAVTGGRLILVGRLQLTSYCYDSQPDFELTINVSEEIDRVRTQVANLLRNIKYPEREIFLFTVCISEAVTNALKHAGAGRCRCWVTPDKVMVEIADSGPGINFKDLPKATLMQHFSTTKSLGCGFTIMLKFLDKIVMATDPHGTTLILEKKIGPQKQKSIDDLITTNIRVS